MIWVFQCIITSQIDIRFIQVLYISIFHTHKLDFYLREQCQHSDKLGLCLSIFCLIQFGLMTFADFHVFDFWLIHSGIIIQIHVVLIIELCIDTSQMAQSSFIRVKDLGGTKVNGQTSKFNQFWPSDVIWQCRPESTLAQLMAFFLVATSHDLIQYWPTVKSLIQGAPNPNT